MDENNRKIKSPWIKGMLAGFGALSLSILLFMFLFNYGKVSEAVGGILRLLRPFIIGAAIAFLLAPACNKMDALFGKLFKDKHPLAARVCSVIVAMGITILFIYLLIIMIIPQVYDSVVVLVNTLPGQLEILVKNIADKLSSNEVLLAYLTTAYKAVTEYVTTWLEESLLPDLAGYIGGVGSGVLAVVITLKDIIIGFVVAIYCLFDRKLFAKQTKKIMYSISGQKIGDSIYGEAKFASKMFSGFIVGKIVDSAIIGVVCYIFCLITRMPNAFLVSVVIGITNIIPFFGPFIGAIPMSLLILIENPMKMLWFVIFIIILQQIDGNVLGPAILGDSVGLSSFWILFSIIVFGDWFGFIGMIVGVPLFAVIYDIVSKAVDRGLERKEIKIEEL